MPRVEHPFPPPAAANVSGWALVYRFFLFDWLFADLSQTAARDRRAAWNHNRRMRRYLPSYLRRWGAVALGAFLIGWLCESGFAAPWMAALWFLGFTVSVAVMAVIVVVWVFTAGIEAR